MREQKYTNFFKPKDVRKKDKTRLKEERAQLSSKQLNISDKLRSLLSSVQTISELAYHRIPGRMKLAVGVNSSMLILRENSKNNKRSVISTSPTTKFTKEDNAILGKGITRRGLLGKKQKNEEEEIDWTFQGIQSLINAKIKPPESKFDFNPLQEIYDIQVKKSI